MSNTSIPTWVRGNERWIALPLEMIVDTPQGRTTEAYFPEGEVAVRLVSSFRRYEYTPTIEGNVLHFKAGADVAVGVYGVEVLVMGVPLRSFKRLQVRVVESNDELPEDMGTAEFEQGGITLDTTAYYFAKGDKGDRGEQGEKGDKGDTFTYEDLTEVDKADLISRIDLTGYINDGDYNSERKAIELKHDDEVVVAIDARPFIKDGMVADVKVADGQLVIMFNTDAGRQDISLALTDIFNPANYYTKGDSDLRFALKSDLVDAYTKGESDARFAALNGSEGQDFAVKDLKIGQYTTIKQNAPSIDVINSLEGGGVVKFPYGKSGVLALTSDIPDVSGKVNVGDVATINEQSLVSGGNLDLATQSEVSALKTALANFCPIIEDTRTAAVATITGVAPFSELVNGQRLLLKMNYESAYDPKLQLTLSNGETTSELRIVAANNNKNLSTINGGWLRVGVYYQLVFDSAKQWWVAFIDFNTEYTNISQQLIDVGTDRISRLVDAKLLVDNFARRVNEVSVADAGEVEQALSANTFYKFGVCDSLTLTLASASAGLAIYAGKFTAGASGCTLVLPDDVQLGANVADIEGGKTYEFSIMDNVLLMVEV